MSVDKKHIKRVADDKAKDLFHEGWRYVPKSLWKEKVRDLDKQTEKKPTKKTKRTKFRTGNIR